MTIIKEFFVVVVLNFADTAINRVILGCFTSWILFWLHAFNVSLKSRLAGSDKKKRLAFNVEALSVGVSFAFIDLKMN